MNIKKHSITLGLSLLCFIMAGFSFKLFRYHNQLRELISIVQNDPNGDLLEKNIAIPTVIERVVGKNQVWRPIQDEAKDAIVQIFCQGLELDMLQPYRTPRQYTSLGTGFFINKDGDIITNAHVVRSAKAIWIQIPSLGKRILDAEVIGESPDRDIALLRLTPEAKECIKEELGAISFLRLGNSDLIRRADDVMVLGYPLGQQALKSTTGIISGREGGFVQISAAINAGNSGGPLLNLNGEVIGINSSKMVGSDVDNIAYVIPVNDMRVILKDLYNVRLLRKPFLGILFNNGTASLTEYLGNPQPGGCYVAEVIKNSTLYKAGVESGDMIYEINGHRIDIYGDMNAVWSEDKISLVDYVSRLSVGQNINLMVYRKGERKEINVTFTQMELPEIRQVYPWLEEIDYEVFAGMVVMQLTANHVRALIKQAPGLMHYADMKNQADPVLLVTHVFPTSQLHRTRTIALGATLNKVNGFPVSTLEGLREAYRNGKDNVLTIRASDHFSRVSDNILIVLPYDKVMIEESKLSRTYRYPLSQTAKELLTEYTQKLQKEVDGVPIATT